MYKITIEKITKTEYPEKDYKVKTDDSGKKLEDDDGYSLKEYYETGKMLIREDIEKVYTQTTEKEIDIKKVIDSFNQ